MKRWVALALVAFAAAVATAWLDQHLSPLTLREEVRIVPDRQVAELLSLDHRGFMADMMFIQVSLHSGGLMWKPLKFQFDSDWSYGMMSLITDLDPKFYAAYLFSGMGLIHNFEDVFRARPIMEKGMAHFPDSWELPFWIGYAHYAYWQDYEVAGEFLWQAYQKPDAPKHFLSLMLNVLRRGGDYEKALQAMTALLDQTDDENVKLVYAKKLVQLKNLALLQKAAEFFQKRFGRPPGDVEELMTAGLIKEIPEDPFGQQYVWNKDKNLVTLSHQDM